MPLAKAVAPGAAAASAAVTATSATTATRPATTPAPTPSGPIHACQTTDLTISPANRQQRDGLYVARFVVADTGVSPCLLDGTIQITPQGPLGAEGSDLEAGLAVSQYPFPESVGVGARSAAAVTVQNGHPADFFIGWFPASPVVCEDGDSFNFAAPDSASPTDTATISYPFGQVCNGLFYVSPVEAS